MISAAAVGVIGAVPAGLPTLSVPVVPLHHLPMLLAEAAGLTLLGFSTTMLAARRFAERNRYDVDPDREGCVFEVKGVPVGLVICEDLWFPEPLADTVAMGAKLVVVPNASPFERGKTARRDSLLETRVQEAGIGLAYLNVVGGQDELVFDGASVLADGDGGVHPAARAFEDHWLVADFDADARRFSPVLWPEEDDETRESLAYRAIVRGIRDYCGKNGFEKVWLGLSGGIDSGLVLALAVDALGARNVAAVRLPSRYTSDLSNDLADEQARLLGHQAQAVHAQHRLALLASGAQARDLTVASWGGAYQDVLREIFFKPYTQASGNKVVDDSWEGGIGLLRTRLVGTQLEQTLVCGEHGGDRATALLHAGVDHVLHILDGLVRLDLPLGICIGDQHHLRLGIVPGRFGMQADIGAVADATRGVRQSATPLMGSLSIGVTSLVAGYYLSEVFARFRRTCPGVDLKVVEDAPPFLEHLLINGELDIAIMVSNALGEPQALVAETLTRSPNRVWMAADHPLAAQDEVGLAECAAHDLVVLQADRIELLMRTVWARHQLKPRTVLRTSSLEAVRSLVGVGAGLAVLPDFLYRPWTLDAEHVEVRTLRDAVPTVDVGLVWRRGSEPRAEVLEFIEVARDQSRTRRAVA